MSHNLTVKELAMADIEILQKACDELGLKLSEHGNHKMYGGQSATGRAIRLPGWDYPVVVNEDGDVVYDNYGGSWGDEKELEKLLHSYARIGVDDGLTAKGLNFMDATQQEDGWVELDYQDLNG